MVDRRGTVTRIDQRTTGDQWEEIQKRLGGIDRATLPTVAEAREEMREANRAAWIAEQQAAREQARPPSVIEARIAECAEQARLAGAVIQRDGAGNRVTGAEALADQLRPDGERQTQTATVQGREAFAARLEDAGIAIVRVTEADVLALAALRQDEERQQQAADANREARTAHRFDAPGVGELAAVTRGGDVHRINPDKLRGVEIAAELPGVVEARAVFEIERERKADLWAERRADIAAARVERAAAFEERQELHRTVRAAERAVEENLSTGAAAVERGFKAAAALFGGAAKLAEAALGFLSDLFAPTAPPTREEAEGMERAADERTEARADHAHAAETAAAQDWQIFEQNRQRQYDDLMSGRLGQDVPREIIQRGRDDRDDDERERERER